MLTRLIQGESAGEQLSESELLHNCIFILNAGHETTTNLIGNALVALQEWPGQRELLVQKIGQSPDWLALEPAMTLAVDEFLRFESSSQPDRLQIERENNRHLAFGLGIHQCAGLSLARMEGRVVIGRFLARFPQYRLTEVPTRGGRARFRGFVRAPFRLA